MEEKTKNLEKFFNPRSIAIIGATEKEGKVGCAVSKNLLKLGYSGKVFFVNPNCKKIFRKKCYPNINDIKTKIDLAVVIIPAPLVIEAVRNASEKTKNFIVISAGFSEIGEEGKKREDELKIIAKEKDLLVLGPNCLGFIIPKTKLNASFAGGIPGAGNIAFVSQSGALAVAIMDLAKNEGMTFSGVYSLGNKMIISEADLLNHLEADPETKVVGIYLEGIGKGQEFLQAAKKISKKKPVIILKAGNTEKSQTAIASHTGSLAGSSEIVSAAFEKVGIVEAKNISQFFSLLELFSKNDPPESDQVAVITNAGGPGVLTADAFLGKTIKLFEFDEEAKAEFRKFLPKESSVENPIDLLGDAQEDRYEKAYSVVNRIKDIGTVIFILTPQSQTPAEKIARLIAGCKKKSSKKIIAVFLGGEKLEKAKKILEAKKIASFNFPEEAVEAIEKHCWWERMKQNRTDDVHYSPNNLRIGHIKMMYKSALEERRNALFFPESKAIFEYYGISTIDFFDSRDKKSLPDGAFPVVVKIDSPRILHKTDRSALILDVKNREELNEAISRMKENFPGENIIIEPMQPLKFELILGIKRDESFGPIIICGLGGIYAEIFRQVDHFVPPLDLDEIKRKLSTGKIAFLFKETRGQRACNIDEIAGIIHSLSELAVENSWIKELDVNPLLIYNDGKGAVAIDIKIIL